MELTTICPVAILGPVLEKDFGTSANIVIKVMDGSVPVIPKVGYSIVDVQSTADMHIKAMESSKAANERFICSEGFYTFMQVAEILRKVYPDKKIPTFVLPNFVTRLLANFEPTLKPTLINLGVERRADNSKAQKLLGWKPQDPKEAVLSCAESVIKLGLA